MQKILIIEDEVSIRNVLVRILKDENKNFVIDESSNGIEGLEKLYKGQYDLVICDIKMPKLDGIEVLSKAIESGSETPFIMISGHGDIDTAVNCIKKGAFDYISKPPDLNRLLTTVRNGLNTNKLQNENRSLKKKFKFDNQMIGDSYQIKEIHKIIEKNFKHGCSSLDNGGKWDW